MNNDLEYEEKLLLEKYLTLMKVLLKIAEDHLNGQTSEIDIGLVQEIMKQQSEILSQLFFLKKVIEWTVNGK